MYNIHIYIHIHRYIYIYIYIYAYIYMLLAVAPLRRSAAPALRRRYVGFGLRVNLEVVRGSG